MTPPTSPPAGSSTSADLDNAPHPPEGRGRVGLNVHLALLATSLIYGLFPLAIKLVIRDLSVWELIIIRLVGTSAIVFIVDRLFFRAKITSREELTQLFLLGLVGVLAVQVLVVLGVQETTTFHASIIMATIPLQTLLLGVGLGREQFSLYKLSGVFIAFLGAVLLMMPRANQHMAPHYLWGDLLILANAFLFACFLIGSRSFLRRHAWSSFSFMSYCYIFSTICFIAALPFLPSVRESIRPLPQLLAAIGQHWFWLSYVVLFASLATYGLNSYALARTQASTVATYVFVQPVIAAIFGIELLGEALTPMMSLAAAVILLGVWFTVRGDGPMPAGDAVAPPTAALPPATDAAAPSRAPTPPPNAAD
jgi:drug/metabolite transporter (DMT)-like permease